MRRTFRKAKHGAPGEGSESSVPGAKALDEGETFAGALKRSSPT